MSFTSDATAILPVPALGLSYYQLSYWGNDDGYTIVAVADNTGIYENGVLVATLNKGAVYSMYSNLDDMTGVHITANKPIAYFVTNTCASIPVGIGYCDCLYEQLFPEALWGVSFMVPVTTRTIDRIRIFASQNGTVITHTGGTVVSGSLNLNAGEFVELEIYKSQGGCYIEANNPVSVASFLTGRTYPGTFNVGDPAIAWIPSIEQFINEITIAPFVATISVIQEHHILIVTKTNTKNQTRIKIGNGNYTTLSGGSWTDHSSGYSFYSLPLTDGNLSYSFTNPSGLVILGYGLGVDESYYYLAGSATRKLNAVFFVNDTHYQDFDGEILCDGNIDINAVIRYQMHSGAGHLRWLLNDLEVSEATDVLEWTTNLSVGTYIVSMIVKDRYGTIDTMKTSFTVDIPVLNVRDTAICHGSIAKPTASSPDLVSFVWFSNANYTDTIIKAASFETAALNSDTAFYVEAISVNGCTSRDTLRVTIYPLPELIVDDDATCSGSTVTPTAASSDAVSLTWYSDVNHTNTIINAASFETAILKSDTVFYIEAISVNGCISRDRLRVTVYPLPGLTVENSAICSGSTVRLTASSSGAVSFAYYSDKAYSDRVGQGSAFLTDVLLNDTVFYIEAASDKDCKSRDSVRITTIPPPEIVAMDDYYLCYGDAVTLATLQSEGTVSWDVESLTVSPVSTQKYVVTASCPPCPDVKDTVTITVGDSLYILPPELPVFKSNTDYLQKLLTNAESPVFTLAGGNLPAGLVIYSDEISGQSIAGEQYDPYSTFLVRVEDIHGCKNGKEYTIEREMFVPRVFTPNGDGVNDIFMQGYQLIIFDRLGIEIYRGDDGWDGSYKGKLAPKDIYFYKLYYKTTNGESDMKTGYIGLQ
ncbi:MAG: gliding motility-associated C-terminal domain-containing protein [Prevotellaceae bacterium]|jgi:gliding motility-associated-like protein|nr:gliding motility-associated C-terminal domain-containing protein [Prevotellaceae bacterium]